MEEIDIIKALAALSHSSRLRVFRALVVTGPTGLTPGQLCERLDIPAATMSFHLKELSNAGLVQPIREGRNLIYSAQFNHMNSVISYLTENCCEGKGCAPVTAPQCDKAQHE
ncbi:MAG: helix-turn-helix domain-containing protein [Burkholderiales bacterium]|jgi:ArsR family transcriptional regulator|uniref:ArsR/SmtB family transcription factor n=1 Tax=Limnobacter sp. TaxID=2003368 RepID=UPI0039BC740D|nr:helix-turn-helix domain-containing protein [Burkholderiales bacterium]